MRGRMKNRLAAVLMGVWWSASLLQVLAAEMPTLRVVPESALLGVPVSIQGKGFRPGEEVILRARSEDGSRVRWESSAVFLADKEGRLDTARQAPLSGNYSATDPAGLFWSMEPQGLEKKDWRPFSFKDIDRMTVTLTAETGGRVQASARVERLIRFPESRLVRESIRAEGLVATLFYPAEGGPHPAIINLGGSGGGLSEQWEGLLSSYGYAVFALAYFGIETLPPDCVEIPLEYFEKAIH
jgi:hypothetical protein